MLLRKPRSYAEVYNDLDGEIVNVFRVLRDPDQGARLRELIGLTPYARAEYYAAFTSASDDPVERARCQVVKSLMGFGSGSGTAKHRSGFRSNSNRSGTTPARDWVNWPDAVSSWTDRLSGVVIECDDYRPIAARHDSPRTLHYVDPPYPFGVRSLPRGAVTGLAYRHEMTDDDHRTLAATLRALSGMVVLSGYPGELYDVELYPDWERHEREHLADGAQRRTEVVWVNPACAAALDVGRDQLLLETAR